VNAAGGQAKFPVFDPKEIKHTVEVGAGSVYEAAPMRYGTRPSGCPSSDRLELGLNICRGSLVKTK
jgi:hypothetical protein